MLEQKVIDQLLQTMDVAAAKQLLGCKEHTDQQVLRSLHQARYERPSSDPVQRKESRQWLEADGKKRVNAKEFPASVDTLP